MIFGAGTPFVLRAERKFFVVGEAFPPVIQAAICQRLPTLALRFAQAVRRTGPPRPVTCTVDSRPPVCVECDVRRSGISPRRQRNIPAAGEERGVFLHKKQTERRAPSVLRLFVRYQNLCSMMSRMTLSASFMPLEPRRPRLAMQASMSSSTMPSLPGTTVPLSASSTA